MWREQNIVYIYILRRVKKGGGDLARMVDGGEGDARHEVQDADGLPVDEVRGKGLSYRTWTRPLAGKQPDGWGWWGGLRCCLLSTNYVKWGIFQGFGAGGGKPAGGKKPAGWSWWLVACDWWGITLLSFFHNSEILTYILGFKGGVVIPLHDNKYNPFSFWFWKKVGHQFLHLQFSVQNMQIISHRWKFSQFS